MSNSLRQVSFSYENDTKGIKVSRITNGNSFKIRDGFDALGFSHTSFSGLMDPLIMVDHYTMTKPTFGAHPHAGLSAVSLLFEDSVGKFHNQDSLGNDFDLLPGDLYWLNAGSGVVHDESPRKNSKTHGLQVFVNLPKSLKHEAPQSTLVRANKMPVIEGKGYRVRVATGQSNGVKGKIIPSNLLTILDGKMLVSSKFTHQPQEGEQSWIYAVSGSIDVYIGEKNFILKQGQSIAANAAGLPISIINKQFNSAHFAMFSGPAIGEKFVQRGPFAMSSEAELNKVQRKYELGLFGPIGKQY